MRAKQKHRFKYEFGELEPVYEEYVRFSQEARKVYSDRKTRNAAAHDS